MGLMAKVGGRLRAWGILVALALSLTFSSGCALLLLGAGGLGGYMIRKGEEGDGSKRKQTSQAAGINVARSDAPSMPG